MGSADCILVNCNPRRRGLVGVAALLMSCCLVRWTSQTTRGFTTGMQQHRARTHFAQRQAIESDTELVAFASWYEEISASQRSVFPNGLRNAARNLVRHRRYRTHMVARGKCKRVADQMKAALAEVPSVGEEPWLSWQRYLQVAVARPDQL